MYAANSEAGLGVYPDLWRKGRCHVNLVAEVAYDPADVDAALEQLEYHAVDAGQWGQSYRDSQDDSRTAELDELQGQGPYVKLVLQEADLDQDDVDISRERLGSVYERIQQICQGRLDEYDYPNLQWSPHAEDVTYPWPDNSRYDLTSAMV